MTTGKNELGHMWDEEARRAYEESFKQGLPTGPRESVLGMNDVALLIKVENILIFFSIIRRMELDDLVQSYVGKRKEGERNSRDDAQKIVNLSNQKRRELFSQIQIKFEDNRGRSMAAVEEINDLAFMIQNLVDRAPNINSVHPHKY